MEIKVELTMDEVLYIQKCIRAHMDNHLGYQWELDLGQSLDKKLEAVVDRPVMTEEELSEELEKSRSWWRESNVLEPLLESMVRADEYELRFRNEVRKAVHEE